VQIPLENMAHLNGNKFSVSEQIDYIFNEDDFRIHSKIGLLSTLCRNKDIVHVGCVDHTIELIQAKAKKNKWLHKHLADSAKSIIGVDIQKEGLEYIHQTYGYEVANLDITHPQPELKSKNYDYLLLPDVLEHIGNPVEFIKKIRESYCDNINKIIITVPNALTHENYKNACKGREIINSDHRFWFTPYTLAKVVVDAGYTLERFYMIQGVKDKSTRSLKNKLYSIPFVRRYIFKDHILTRGTIVLIASFEKIAHKLE